MKRLSDAEYRQLKHSDMEQAIKRVREINASDRAVYKETRPITDLKHMIATSAELYKERPAFLVKQSKGAPYTPVSYEHFMNDINALGTALLNRGMGGKHIGIIGENSYEWAVTYLAIVCGVGVVVPIDKELYEEDIRGILTDGEVSAVFFSDKISERIRSIDVNSARRMDMLVNISKADDRESSRDDVLTLEQLLSEGRNLLAEGNRDYLDAQIFRDEMAVLLFTSGTTGRSKGVMLSHWNLVENISLSITLMRIYNTDIFFSVLPLHHTYACTCDFLIPLYSGACVAHCEGLKYIQKNLVEVRPTMFLGVPLLYERLYKNIWKTTEQKGKAKKLKMAIALNRNLQRIGIDISHKLFKDILAVFGGRLRIMISGGAAINPGVIQGFRDFGINALQGYGLTECSPLGTLNPDNNPKNASVGKAFPQTEIRIDSPSEDGVGEICIRGEHVMLGYYKDKAATDQAIIDGWFHSGDLGFMDEDGYLYIAGRKKNVIITKNGKNVFPEELEEHILSLDLVEEVMVWADIAKDKDDTMIIATIVPNWDEAAAYIENCDKDDEETLRRLESIFWEGIDAINNRMPLYKRIKRIVIKPEPFVKNTSTKIKRFEESNKGV